MITKITCTSVFIIKAWVQLPHAFILFAASSSYLFSLPIFPSKYWFFSSAIIALLVCAHRSSMLWLREFWVDASSSMIFGRLDRGFLELHASFDLLKIERSCTLFGLNLSMRIRIVLLCVSKKNSRPSNSLTTRLCTFELVNRSQPTRVRINGRSPSSTFIIFTTNCSVMPIALTSSSIAFDNGRSITLTLLTYSLYSSFKILLFFSCF